MDEEEPMDPQLLEAFLFFKKFHEGQTYTDGQPYWPHILRVGLRLKAALQNFGEADEETRNLLALAGFGHDSLEDTKIKADEISARFGVDAVHLIVALTNEEGDFHTESYVEKICLGSEEARLIKLSDLIDNYTRIAFRIKENDPVFLQTKIIPIMEPMFRRIITTTFQRYPKTSRYFFDQVILCHDLAIQTLNNP